MNFFFKFSCIAAILRLRQDDDEHFALVARRMKDGKTVMMTAHGETSAAFLFDCAAELALRMTGSRDARALDLFAAAARRSFEKAARRLAADGTKGPQS